MSRSETKFKTLEQFEVFYKSSECQIIDKVEFLSSFCKGKSVLDLGCIDHSHLMAGAFGDVWLHKKIKNVADSLTGVDILEDDIKILNEKGFNIIKADVEKFDLSKQFDVVVAGDLIEHLSNIGLFLDNVRNHMHEKSIFVLSTPNPFNAGRIFKALFDNMVVVHPQHTVWLDPLVLWELLNRHGLKIVDFAWVTTRFNPKVAKPFYKPVINYLIKKITTRRKLLRTDFALVIQKK